MARQKKPLPPLEWLTPRVRASRVLTLLFLVALVALMGAWYLGITDLHGARPWVIFAVLMLPLALVTPGMLLGSARAHAWACYVLNIYFIHGVITAFEPGRLWFGAALAVLSGLLFSSALLYTRWRYQVDRRLSGES